MTYLWAAVLVAADQASKVWAQATFGGGERWPLGAGVTLTYVENTGAAFGMLQGLSLPLGPVTLDGTLLLGLLSLVVAVWLAVQLGRRETRGVWLRGALLLILAGALGNMIDRFRLGYVIDFVHLRLGALSVPVFNLADALVVVGAALLVGVTLLAPQPSRKEA